MQALLFFYEWKPFSTFIRLRAAYLSSVIVIMSVEQTRLESYYASRGKIVTALIEYQ